MIKTMTRYEEIMVMTMVGFAKWFMAIYPEFDGYCKSECDADLGDCPHPLECCVRWLGEEVEK